MMFRKAKGFWILLFVMSIIPIFNVHALSATTVTDQADLKEALANKDITTITLGGDIETTEKINITRPVTIDGNGHTMKYVGTFDESGSTDNTKWAGIYLLQVYKTNATIRNIKLTGGNAGLLVNGSTVKLEGEIDVSGNGFGGIELSQGANVDEQVHIVLDDNTNIVNTTETANTPTLWVPDDSDNAIVEINGEILTITSGDELSLQEFNVLIADPENPNTSDSIIVSLIISLIGLVILGYMSKKELFQS